MKKVILAGATGLVGGQAAQLLRARRDIELSMLARRDPGFGADGLLLGEMQAWPSLMRGQSWDAAICALGTTIKKAGSQTAFEEVDLRGVLRFAAAAQAQGVPHFLVVSSVGASSDSKNFYLRTKGRAEEGILARGFSRVDIFQPGLLRGPRSEKRLGERMAQMVQPLLDPLLLGGLAQYRSIASADVAQALVSVLGENAPGVFRHTNTSILALAQK